MARTVLTPIGFLYAPALFTPQTNRDNPSQGARFSTLLAFDDTGVGSTAYQELRAAVKEAIAEKFSEAKANDAAFVRSLRLPFRDASEKAYLSWANATVFISAWKKGDQPAPDVVDLNGQKIMVPSDVFGGQLARMTVRPFAYDAQGNKGVSFALEHVQIVKADMPRQDGKQSGEDAFKGADLDPNQMAALGIGNASGGGTGGGAGDDLPF